MKNFGLDCFNFQIGGVVLTRGWPDGFEAQYDGKEEEEDR